MKMQVLKKRAWETWVKLNSFKGELTSTVDAYVKEIKAFGDRRYKKTWVKALARLRAIYHYQSTLDAWALIVNGFNFTPERWDYEIRNEILDEFLMYEDGLDIIRCGLEQIFASSEFSAEEQRETRCNGFFELLAGRESKYQELDNLAGLS